MEQPAFELETYQRLCDALPDMLLRLAADGSIITVHPPQTFASPIPLDGLAGRRLQDVLPADGARIVENALELAAGIEGVTTADLRFEDDGHTNFYELRMKPTAHGEFVVILRNVTDPTLTAQRLLNRDRELERLIHASTRINAERSIKGVLQEIAHSAREVIGCRYAALGIINPEGDALEKFVVSGLDDSTIEKIGKLPTGKGILGMVIDDPAPLRLCPISGHPESAGFPPNHPPMTSFLGVPVLGPDNVLGNLYFTDKIGADTFSAEDEAVAVMFAANAAVAVQNARLDEEAVRLLAELQRLHRSRDRFYAMVNHELRNALTAVHGWAELLQRKSGDDPPRVVRETVESAQYALELMNDLLDLSRLDAEMVELRTAETTTAALANEAIGTVQPRADEEGITLRADPASTDGCVTDPRRVRQILVNLLSNAIRHSPKGSTVTVAMQSDEDSITFRVIDQGEGIGPEELAIIFDAYQRAASSAGGGTGLGLTLSRRLARMLGGDLTVESERDKGATFTLTISRYLE